jgi:hypothetical protein
MVAVVEAICNDIQFRLEMALSIENKLEQSKSKH